MSSRLQLRLKTEYYKDNKGSDLFEDLCRAYGLDKNDIEAQKMFKQSIKYGRDDYVEITNIFKDLVKIIKNMV